MLQITLLIYWTFKKAIKFTLNKNNNPKKGRNVNIKISLEEIIHKIIRNKIECELIIANLGINKR